MCESGFGLHHSQLHVSCDRNRELIICCKSLNLHLGAYFKFRGAHSKDLSSSKSASGCTEKYEENAAVRDAYEAVPVVHCTALQLLRRNMELLQQGPNH